MRILSSLPPEISEAGASFGGGTYCSMICGEYRESEDIDLLCSSPEGYSRLKLVLGPESFTGLIVRKIRYGKYSIKCLLEVDEVPVKLEIVAEGVLDIIPVTDSRFPIPVISIEDLAAAKLYANSDRWPDAATNSRDILDLGMLLACHTPDCDTILGRIPERDFRFIERGLEGGLRMLANPKHFRMASMNMNMDMRDMATARIAAKRFLAKFRERMAAKAGNLLQSQIQR